MIKPDRISEGIAKETIHLDHDVKQLTNYFQKSGYLGGHEKIEKTEVPGAGNMNFVLRVVPSDRPSFIVKQARPWVEKFPDIPATVERIKTEMRYYDTVNGISSLTTYSPKIKGFDQENSILIMEDLGDSQDYTYIYQTNEGMTSVEIEQCISYINELHKIPFDALYPRNLDLRKLNHQHIFNLPFVANNGFNLDNVQPGLQQLSNRCCKDYDLVSKVRRLGELYLGSGDTLLHGDFYPGSLLKVNSDFRVIDPEFSFFGPSEWDISVFIAHLFMADTDQNLIQAAFKNYNQKEGFGMERFAGFVGTEILRRLVGLAQLPLELSLDQKSALVDRSMDWVKSGKVDILD